MLTVVLAMVAIFVIAVFCEKRNTALAFLVLLLLATAHRVL